MLIFKINSKLSLNFIYKKFKIDEIFEKKIIKFLSINNNIQAYFKNISKFILDLIRIDIVSEKKAIKNIKLLVLVLNVFKLSSYK